MATTTTTTATTSEDKDLLSKAQATVKGYADKVDVAKAQETVKGYADKVDVAKVQETVKGYADKVDVHRIQDAVIEYLAKAEGYVVDGVRTAAERAEEYLPEVELAAEVPTAEQVVEHGFTFAQRLLDNQKDFAKDLLVASTPVRSKVKRPAPAPAAKTTKATKATKSTKAA